VILFPKDSTTSLTASWTFADPESGIDHYKISAYQQHGGKWTRVYPTSYVMNLMSTLCYLPPLLHDEIYAYIIVAQNKYYLTFSYVTVYLFLF